MTKAIKLLNRNIILQTRMQPIVNYVIQTYAYRLNVSLQYTQGSTADPRTSTTNNTKVGPCNLTTQMLKPTADQKISITIT